MKRKTLGALGVAAVASAITALVLLLNGNSQPNSKPIHVFVIVPSAYSSTVTPEQAVSAVQIWLGQPTDAPCIGNQFTCSIEGWFRHELGQVFDYQVIRLDVATRYDAIVDSCGSTAYQGAFYTAQRDILAAGYALDGQRTMVELMGGGGWAGHFPAQQQQNAFGMVGDWGVMNQYHQDNGCDPTYEAPAHGFSHEFAGMLGEYLTSGYNEGGLFVGDVMSDHEKHDLQRNSGKWLRSQ